MIEYFKDLFLNLKNNHKYQKILFIIIPVYIILLSLCIIKVDKEVVTPGVLNNPSSFLEIDNAEDKVYNKGNINTIGVYVTYRPSILQYIFSLGNKSVEISDYNMSNDLSPIEQTKRSTILKDLSIINALITGYEKAKEKDSSIVIEHQFEGIIITAVLPNAYSDEVKIGDLIVGVKINGNKTYLSNYQTDHIDNFVNLISESNDFTLIIKEDDKEKEVEYGWSKDGYLMLELNSQHKITKTIPSYSIDSNTVHQSIGSSGGMMLALSIYNSLIEEDVTKGKMICGTGTVDLSGNIGPIGGIKQKIFTSQLYKADIFFCPYSDDISNANYENYLDAKLAYSMINKPTFELIKVKNLDMIIDYLESIGE